jgi:CheY-like chemotaxis protein
MSNAEQLLSWLLKSPRLLCVEADRFTGSIEQAVGHYACELERAESGAEALVKLAGGKYDLVLLLGPLPDMTVGQFLRQMKVTTPDLPVVLAGAFAADKAYGAMAQRPVTVLNRPLLAGDVDELFRVFKIKARSRQDQYFFQSHQPLAAA